MAGASSDRDPDRLAAFIVPAAAEEGAELPIRSYRARIGQGPQNDLVLDDDSVSTQHAQLDHQAGCWLLTDLDSKNGTYINGTRLVSGVATEVPDGALVAFGALKLRFRFGVPEPASHPNAGAVSPTAERRSTGFRLPVWLLLLILLLIAAIVFLVITFTGGPAIQEPGANLPAALLMMDLEAGGA